MGSLMKRKLVLFLPECRNGTPAKMPRSKRVIARCVPPAIAEGAVRIVVSAGKLYANSQGYGVGATKSGAWLDLMTRAAELHPITRACMGFHLWSLAGLGKHSDQLEAAVTAGRIAAREGRGAIFAPLAMGGAGALRAGGSPRDRLVRWLNGVEEACLTAMRNLDDIEAWSTKAEIRMSALSGKTPPALRRTLAEWPLVSAPMAEALTGASRAAVQRNLAWMEARGLIREVTGQGRFRMWRAAA